MKPFLLILPLFLSFYCFGQNGTDSSAEEYCLVRIYDYSLSNKVQVSADFGMNKRKNMGRDILRDEIGKKRTFLSEADALNFFGSEGWKLVNAFPVRELRESYTRYVFKRSTPAQAADINN